MTCPQLHSTACSEEGTAPDALGSKLRRNTSGFPSFWHSESSTSGSFSLDCDLKVVGGAWGSVCLRISRTDHRGWVRGSLECWGWLVQHQMDDYLTIPFPPFLALWMRISLSYLSAFSWWSLSSKTWALVTVESMWSPSLLLQAGRRSCFYS